MENAIGYGVLETAIGHVLKLSSEATVGMLRARVIHLRRGGFGPRGQGPGSRIPYDRDTATRWLLALLFEDAGLSPLNVMGLIAGTWEGHIGKIVTRARKPSKTDTYLAISYSELRRAAGVPVAPNVSAVTARGAAKLFRWLDDERHVTVFNLSAVLRVFDREVAAAQALAASKDAA